jgi:hypothetical protein
VTLIESSAKIDEGMIREVEMVGVAQLVEPRVVIPVVVGSSPIVHPNSPAIIVRARMMSEN